MNVFGATSVSFDNTTFISQPLTASAFASPNVVSVGQPVSLSCTATGGTSPYTYSWDLGDGTTGAGSTLSHMYSTPGAMTVVCTVTDNLSIQASATASVTVN